MYLKFDYHLKNMLLAHS